ncbi:DUF2268 domain-containing putative Zn-dependent protease [Alicyclobacillus dauci]|uniref:DUF2268 domain-containing protein n=1 Tax=Alicyclobacillus dauci TaxID=1475485 RepID=A0ABY6YZR4_9BACL|nr:DUF2268 domain-containing putative Zn-dependent protease [Alicyclobacillus dauci]WAH36077.1 DUF2268 domain-containing protein [Alicyclobacillus dauci]
MIEWKWLYRDSISALRTSSRKNWFDLFVRQYIHQHWDLLYSIHFKPKGYKEKADVLSRIKSVGYERYTQVASCIGGDLSEFERNLQRNTQGLLKRLNVSDTEQEIYVITGLDATNIYTTSYQNRSVTVLCLEAAGGRLSDLELLVSHECHHFARQAKVNHNIFEASIHERLVTEGLASCFSEEVQPGRPVHEYCYVPETTVEWVVQNSDRIQEILAQLPESEAMNLLFSRRPTSVLVEEVPSRTGYVYGYQLVKHFLEESGITAQSAADVPWMDVFPSYRAPFSACVSH